MRILMFGWEFPPHISGGLGTACYGLTKGLLEDENNEIIFVVPKAWGDEKIEEIEIIGANRIQMAHLTEDQKKNFKMIGIRADIVPYIDDVQFWKLKKERYKSDTNFVEVTEEGTIDFSGTYGPSLYQEIREYALVASEIAKENIFDVIHAHDWMTFPAAVEAKRVSEKPLVVHVHATDFDRTGGNANPVVYSIEREAMEIADKVVTVSNLTKKIVVEKYKIPKEKVETVYNAVEPQGPTSPAIYRKIPGEKNVVFLGRLTVQKGPEYFVEAASLVLKRDDKARFIMAGSGDMLESLIEQTARLGIAHRFHFTGFLNPDEVHHLLDISDVFVMPSVSEPFGIAPLEAMQAGVPVIVSKQSGVAEILKYACKIDFWDTFAMADAIYGLLNYPALANMFSKNGAIEAGSLEWKHSAGMLNEIYEQLTGKSKKAGDKKG